MKKITQTLVVFLTIITSSVAQKIEVKKNIFGGYQYLQYGRILTDKEIVKTLQSNQEALNLFYKAQTNRTVSLIISGIGGYLVGNQIGKSLVGEEPDLKIIGVGVGIILITIPISSSVKKNTNQAVKLYNSSLKLSSRKHLTPKLNVVTNNMGVGLSIVF